MIPESNEAAIFALFAAALPLSVRYADFLYYNVALSHIGALERTNYTKAPLRGPAWPAKGPWKLRSRMMPKGLRLTALTTGFFFVPLRKPCRTDEAPWPALGGWEALAAAPDSPIGRRRAPFNDEFSGGNRRGPGGRQVRKAPLLKKA